jgi:hypothetical protein
MDLIVIFALFMNSAKAETLNQCLGAGNWGKPVDQIAGNFSGKINNKAKKELVQLWYLKTPGPFSDNGINVAALTISRVDKGCLAAKFGRYGGGYGQEYEWPNRKNAEVPHKPSILNKVKLSEYRDIIKVTSIRRPGAPEEYQKTSLFLYNEKTKDFNEVWSGETGSNQPLSGDDSKQLNFMDVNGDSYYDFVLSTGFLDELGVVSEDPTTWIWDNYHKKFLRLYEDKNKIKCVWFIKHTENQRKLACSKCDSKHWLCVPIRNTTIDEIEILGWEDSPYNDKIGLLHYSIVTQGSPEDYMEERCIIIDKKKKKPIGDHPVKEFLISNRIEDAQLGLEKEYKWTWDNESVRVQNEEGTKDILIEF